MVKEAVDIATKKPLQSIAASLLIISLAVWQGFFTDNAVSKEFVKNADNEVLKEAEESAEKLINEKLKPINKKLGAMECNQLRAELFSMDSRLGDLIEQEKASGSVDRRRRIREISLTIEDIRAQKDKSCHGQ